MSVLCQTCGRQSQDTEFCDHCNADLGSGGPSLAPERCPLPGGGVTLEDEQRLALRFPETSLIVPADGRFWRVHWIPQHVWQERGRQIETRLALQAAALPPGQVIADPRGNWLAFESNPGAPLPWAQPAFDDPLRELQRLSACVHSLTHALDSLHKHSFVWLNFDPNALEDAGPLPTSDDWRSLLITNLDLNLFPLRALPERVRLHPHFAAPEVVQFRADDIGPRTDVYHLAAFAYYWLAKRLPDGLPGSGPASADFAFPFLRVYAPRLPEGIIPILARGLSVQPVARYDTLRAFAHALDEAIIAAYRRRGSSNRLRWDIGGHTCAGKSKSEQQRDNEDSIFIRNDGDSALALVADGVSTCDVGSGSLASTMTAIVVENAFADGATHESFPQIVADATRRGSQGLLEWALARDCRDELVAGKDLMGTTLTLAWLQDRDVSLANLGDSRAYLISADGVEQLTVDGDLASDLLAQGMAPEEVKELGTMGRALRECVGGCTVNDDGEPVIMPESCAPSISRWPIVPGDVIVLCTDGLVEEGFFLEPQTMADLVRRNRDRPAAELAVMLVEAADALQRAPSIVEPDGFGDNISCVVIKITEAV